MRLNTGKPKMIFRSCELSIVNVNEHMKTLQDSKSKKCRTTVLDINNQTKQSRFTGDCLC